MVCGSSRPEHEDHDGGAEQAKHPGQRGRHPGPAQEDRGADADQCVPEHEAEGRDRADPSGGVHRGLIELKVAADHVLL